MEALLEQEQIICGLLDETNALLPRLEEMVSAEAEELYGLLNQAAKFTSENAELLRFASLRAALCDRRDIVLDALIDKDPPVLPHDDKCARPRQVYAPYHHEWGLWGNEFLLKDTGVAPYMLAKALGAEPVIFFGDAKEQYPYLEYLPGLEFLTVERADDPAKRREQYLSFLRENAARIDILTLHGLYAGPMMKMLSLYRRFRPEGKVYITLDMNGDWQKRIPWDEASYVEFFDRCDAVTNSCRTMRDSVNGDPSVNFDSFWISNAFFNANNIPVIADPKRKENVMLTVGRIGSAQKKNEELLLAFAKVANALPNWRVHLVGSTDDRIKPFIAKYFETYPHLKKRVIFKGKIADKSRLYREYAQAKVFVLTSDMEGGTPNVYAEALRHGCAFITSDVDGADDITNYGQLGIKYTRGDKDALAGAMTRLCRKADANFFKSHIPAALAYADRYYDWERNAKKIAYMLYH